MEFAMKALKLDKQGLLQYTRASTTEEIIEELKIIQE